ncbi:hypothetical protein ACQY0O_001241 [Thecaphora frezii]
MVDTSFDKKGKPDDDRFWLHQAKPLNAELVQPALASHLITPTGLLFHRNHNDLVYQPPSAASDWQVDVSLAHSLRGVAPWQSFAPQRLSLERIRSCFLMRQVVATLECAGNRRADFKDQQEAEGIQWGSGVIANVVWRGVSLRDLLTSVGVPDPYDRHPVETLQDLVPSEERTLEDAAEWARKLHLHMLSAQESSESDDPNRHEVFAASIPLPTAMHPNQSCILAYAHNGEPLLPSHGFPLRAVIPGHAGARWVKWLLGLVIGDQENQSPPMRLDYKILSPPKHADNRRREAWLQRMQSDETFRKQELLKQKPLQRLGASSAITEPKERARLPASSAELKVKGYAVGQDGSPTAQVYIAIINDADPSLPSHVLVERLPCHLAWHTAKLSFEPAAKAAIESRQRLASSGHATALAEETGEKDKGRHHEWSWAWCLWQADLPVPGDAGAVGKKWAVVARSVTAAGVEQERVSAWNLRGFCERGWPVVRGISFQVE